MAKSGRGELSYGYWHGKGGGDAPVAAPQKLSDTEAAALCSTDRPPATSAWNAAGTWEERDWTAWAKDRLKTMFCALTVPLATGGELRVKDMTSCTGDATVASIRGVPRHGFDFDVTLSWTCELGNDEDRVVKGTINCPDASRSAVGDTAEDLSYTFTIDKNKLANGKEEVALRDAGKALRRHIFASLQQLDAEMQRRLDEQAGR